MRTWICIILNLSTLIAWGQKEIKPTDEFTVVGQIEHEIKFNLADLEKFQSKKLEDVIITNHLGEKRGTAKSLTGIPIKDILKNVEFKVESPKVLSEFFLTFIASDGYKVVYSWNEIFNTATGDNIYLITEKEGKKIREMTERILVITTTDFKTGRRNIKGLSKIVVGRVE
jgi:hypothetical protein